MDVVCERCSAKISAEDIDLSSRLAKCRRCQAVFDFSPQISRPAPLAASPPQAIFRPIAPQPEGITVVEDEAPPDTEPGYRSAPAKGGRLVMRRSWYAHHLWFVGLFCLVWDGFLINWYRMLTGVNGDPGLIFYLFPLVHVAAGIGLTYYTIAGFLNKTWITVTADEVTVRHAPIPWFGNRSLPAGDIHQIYCEEIVTKNRGTSRTYTLSAVLRDGRKVDLVKSLPAAAQARYLEQRLEERLGIEPSPVAGEFQG